MALLERAAPAIAAEFTRATRRRDAERIVGLGDGAVDGAGDEDSAERLWTGARYRPAELPEATPPRAPWACSAEGQKANVSAVFIAFIWYRYGMVRCGYGAG